MDLKKSYSNNIVKSGNGKLISRQEVHDIQSHFGDEKNYIAQAECAEIMVSSPPVGTPVKVPDAIELLARQLLFCMDVLEQYNMITGNKLNIKELE